VKAKTLVVVALKDHALCPSSALDFARLLHAQTLELESDCGHIATGCESQKINEAVAAFLE
jgi:homoserine O-acetyltransferase